MVARRLHLWSPPPQWLRSQWAIGRKWRHNIACW
jgi:hypothetical protein